MMEPGPMALTRIACGANDSAMHLQRRPPCLLPKLLPIFWQGPSARQNEGHVP